MTDDQPEKYTTTVEIGDDATFTVEGDDLAHLDYSCGPGLDLTITSERERLSVTIEHGMEEHEAGALAAALLRALESTRGEATRRGYYSYVAEGRPEYGPPYEWETSGNLTDGARGLLVELMKDPDSDGRPRAAFAHLPLPGGFDGALAELDAAGLVGQVESDGQMRYRAAGAAWITAGTRETEPSPLPGDGLVDALRRVEAFVAGDDTHALRISDLAAVTSALRDAMSLNDTHPLLALATGGRLVDLEKVGCRECLDAPKSGYYCPGCGRQGADAEHGEEG